MSEELFGEFYEEESNTDDEEEEESSSEGLCLEALSSEEWERIMKFFHHNTHYQIDRINSNIDIGLNFLNHKSTKSDDPDIMKAKMIDILKKIRDDINDIEHAFDHY